MHCDLYVFECYYFKTSLLFAVPSLGEQRINTKLLCVRRHCILLRQSHRP